MYAAGKFEKYVWISILYTVTIKPGISLPIPFHPTSHVHQPQASPFPRPGRSCSRSGQGLDGESLDLVAEGLDLAGELGGLVGGDAGGDHGAADTARTAEESLARDVDVRCSFIFTEQGDVQNHSQRFSVGGQDGYLAGTTVEGLGNYDRGSVHRSAQRDGVSEEKKVNVPSLAPFLA